MKSARESLLSLTPDAVRRLTEGIEDVEAGRTVSLDDAKDRLGIDE